MSPASGFASILATPWATWLAIATGGAAGSVLRHVVGLAVQRNVPGFPWGTLAINVSGSFLLGFLARATGGSDPHAPLRAALTVGLCGGYTTFSTFSFETLSLVEGGLATRAVLYVIASTLLALVAVFLGVALGRVVAPTAP